MLPAQKSQKGGEKPGPKAKVDALPAAPKGRSAAAPAKKMVRSEIPKAPVNRGLKMKMPKGKGEEQIQRRLKKQSPWFNSILNPLHGADAKIPDETGVETGTTQIVFKDTVTANANGLAGWRSNTLYINSVNIDATPTEIIGHNYDHLADDAGLINIDWNSTNQWPGADDLKAITGSHRIVSASLTVMPETSLATNQGEFTLFSAPFTVETSPHYLDYVNKYKSTTLPVNCNKPGIVRWYPIAKEDISFKNFIRTEGTRFATTISDDASVPLWELGFIAAGVEAGATFRVTCVVNYEFVPRYNSLNVLGTSPSPQDATEVDLVENWVQDMDVAGTVSFASAASAPKTVEPQHGENDEGTGFGMFFNVVKEILPFAAALLI